MYVGGDKLYNETNTVNSTVEGKTCSKKGDGGSSPGLRGVPEDNTRVAKDAENTTA